MQTWKRRSCVVLWALALLAALPAAAQAQIDNGVIGDGRWEVVVESAGDSTRGSIDPTGPIGLSEIIYGYFTHVDNGADGGGVRLSNSTLVPATLTAPGQVTSSGSFAGPNGAIAWTSVSTIAPGSTVLNNALTFSSPTPFGTVRLISYFDEDVLGPSDDVLIVIGTPGANDFQLLTLDNTDNVGVGHTASYNTSTNATYIGWAADAFNDLESLIFSAGAIYSVPGVIDTISLPPIVDPRFPANPAYGPEDITNAFAFNLNPSATTATLDFALGGSPSGQPPAVASFTWAPSAPTTGQIVQFTDTSTGNPTSWAWDFDGNGIRDSTAQHPQFTYNAAGTYTVKLTVSNSGGSNPTTRTLTVRPAVPAVVVSARPEGLIQLTGAGGATTTFAVTNAGDVATTVSLSQTGAFFTLSQTSFVLQPKASQVITVTGLPQSEGYYSGSVLVSGERVPPGLAIPITLLSKNPPAGTVDPIPGGNRVDVAGVVGQNPTGSVTFTNRGSATLTGIVVSDVEWIVPQTGTITIPPGGTVSVSFTIDRSKRPDASRLIGSVDGSLSLVYLKGTAGKGSLPDPHDSVNSASSRVTIVDTVQPTVVDAPVPPLGAGEVAMFIPGVGRLLGLGGRLFLSDVTFLNQRATGALGTLRLYYTPVGGSSASAKSTSLVQLPASQPVGMYDIVKSIFLRDGEIGSLQIRTPEVNDLAVNANIFNVSNPAGTYGTTIPVFRSDRSAGSGQKLFLTGLHKSSTSYTNMFIQETSGQPVTVQTQFYSAAGSPVGAARSDAVSPFAVLVLGKIVPDGAVSAILTPQGTTGRIQAYATPVDEASGDFRAVADWTSIYGYAKNSVVTIPVAGSVRGANNTFFRTDLAIMNTGTSTASGKLSFHSRTGERFDKDISLSPKQSSIIGNVMGTLFNITVDSVGFLTFTPSSSTGSFVVTSRTYTTVEGQAATYGTGVPTTSTQNALKLGKVRRLGGIEDASRATITAARPATFRTNIGLMETSGSPIMVRVTIRYSYPTSLVVAKGEAFKEYPLTARQFLLVNNIARDILGESRETRFGDLRNMEIDFEVISGTGSLALFTSSIDNGTGDSLLRVD